MNKLKVNGDWNITKGKLKQKWAKFTDDDLQYVEGKNDELLGRIQKRTGETRELAEQAEANVERKLASAEIESKAKLDIERWENEGGGFSFPGQHPIKRRDFLV